jgi:hypothetical protein
VYCHSIITMLLLSSFFILTHQMFSLYRRISSTKNGELNSAAKNFLISCIFYNWGIFEIFQCLDCHGVVSKKALRSVCWAISFRGGSAHPCSVCVQEDVLAHLFMVNNRTMDTVTEYQPCVSDCVEPRCGLFCSNSFVLSRWGWDWSGKGQQRMHRKIIVCVKIWQLLWWVWQLQFFYVIFARVN